MIGGNTSREEPAGRWIAATLSLLVGCWSGRVAAQCEIQEYFGTQQQDDGLGGSVAIHGDVAVAGNGLAFDVPGYVDVYRRQDATWVVEATLTSGVVNCMNRFGICATDGGVIVVGDRLECNGAVYVFRYDGEEWPLEVVLTASDGQPGDHFGQTVSIDDDRLLVGAPLVGPNQGAAYVFRRDDAMWIEEAKLTDPKGEAGDVFGWSVALSGDVALIGGHGNNQIKGAAFVFRRVEGEWVLEQELSAWDDPTFQVRFGWSVAVAGNVAAVGAPANIGAVYVFEFDGASWQPGVKLTGSMPLGIGPWFGSSVAMNATADLMLVGALLDHSAGAESGAAYLFRRRPEWVEVNKFIAADTDGADQFAGAVAVSGDAAIIGAPGNNSSGKVYFFAGMTGGDCNGNDEPDGCDIAQGASEDLDGDGVPDECQVVGDVTGDGLVDVLDLVVVILAWGPCAAPCPPVCPADVDSDCTVGVEDLTVIVESWGRGG
jgi:hypothetical protein